MNCFFPTRGLETSSAWSAWSAYHACTLEARASGRLIHQAAGRRLLWTHARPTAGCPDDALERTELAELPTAGNDGRVEADRQARRGLL